MPVYEFYCQDCHTIFNFRSSRVNTEKQPDCPRCGKPNLERQVSRFAVSRGRTDEPGAGMPDLDEEKLEKAMMSLAGDMEGMDENDPRQMGRFMRRLSESTGVNFGAGFEEALRRLEAGEDPEKIEAELGDIFDGENPFGTDSMKKLRHTYTPPAHDETLYTL